MFRIYYAILIVFCLFLLSGCALELAADLSLEALSREEVAEGALSEAEASAFRADFPFEPSLSIDEFNIKMARLRLIHCFNEDWCIVLNGDVNAKVDLRLLTRDSVLNTKTGKGFSLHGAEIFRSKYDGVRVLSVSSDFCRTIKFTLSVNQPVFVYSVYAGYYLVSTGINHTGYVKMSDNSIVPIYRNSRFANTSQSVPYSNANSRSIGDGNNGNGRVQYVNQPDRVDRYRRGPHGETLYVISGGFEYFINARGIRIYIRH